MSGRTQTAMRAATEKTPPDPLALTAGCFRLPGGWALRREVDRELLRGRRTPIPVAFAKRAGLRPARSLALPGPACGRIRLSWPQEMPLLGSLRVVAKRIGAKEGDCLFVILWRGRHRRLDLHHVPRLRYERARGIRHLALECGRKPRDPLDQITRALDLDPRAADREAAVRERLIARGEPHLAALLGPAAALSAAGR